MTTIPDDVIADYLGALFGRSSPGDVLSHLYAAAADPGDVGPLGLVDPAKLYGTIYAIAPDAGVESVDAFVLKVIAAAAAENAACGRVVHFAALALEAHTAYVPESDEVAHKLARRLHADGKLPEHPNAVEVTMLYAACRDGRRWIGRHVLTGPTAGTITGPDLRVGPLADDERASPFQRAVRMLVTRRGV